MEAGNGAPLVSLVSRQKEAFSLLTKEDPPQLGPTAKVQWTIAGMYDRKLIQIRCPNHQEMKTREAQSRGVIAWFTSTIRIPEDETKSNVNSGSVSARIVFTSEAMCQHFVEQHKNDGVQYAVDVFFFFLQHRSDDTCLTV